MSTRFSIPPIALIFLDSILIFCLLFVPTLWVLSSWELGGVTVDWNLLWFVLAVILVVARVGVRKFCTSQGMFRRDGLAKSLGSVWFVFLLFVGVEQLFEMTGFEYKTAAISIRTTEAKVASVSDKPIPKGKVMRVHPELRWRFIPNVEWNGRKMNSLGFSDREFTRKKAEGTFRVVSLGDSCTAQSDWPYSRWLDKLLREDPPSLDHEWEAFNMGTHGYSVVQGAKLFELETDDMAPDIVSIYFGWNDHWLSGGPSDRDRLRNVIDPTTVGRIFAVAHNLLAKKRFGQWLIQRRHEAVRGEKSESTTEALRVPPVDFRNTLRNLCRDIRAVGGVPLLMTAPRDKTISGHLVHSGQIDSVERGLELHDQYGAIVRQVAAEMDAELLDLAAAFTTPETQKHFTNDGIHFGDDGRQLIAQLMHGKIKEMVAEGRVHATPSLHEE